METAERIAVRKKELKAMGVYERRSLWLKLHKQAEFYNNLFGGAGIVCAAVSSQLAGQPKVLLCTGLTAAISTTLVTFLNLKTRSIAYINAWRILDQARSLYLAKEDVALETVVEAMNKAEEHIANTLHKA